jgi:hypothetical protein
MGLLDDAIREHLELKRRHGADPDEVSRQEREALGAPVRGEFAKREGEAAADETGDEPDAADAEAEAEAPVRDDVAPEPEIPEADFLDPPRERAPAPEPEPDEDPDLAAKDIRPGDEEDPWLVEELAEEEPEPEPPAKKPDGEDVLEETPEFLQETPEHDRLWFEQKPPRDFDWDK